MKSCNLFSRKEGDSRLGYFFCILLALSGYIPPAVQSAKLAYQSFAAYYIEYRNDHDHFVCVLDPEDLTVMDLDDVHVHIESNIVNKKSKLSVWQNLEVASMQNWSQACMLWIFNRFNHNNIEYPYITSKALFVLEKLTSKSNPKIMDIANKLSDYQDSVQKSGNVGSFKVDMTKCEINELKLDSLLDSTRLSNSSSLIGKKRNNSNTSGSTILIDKELNEINEHLFGGITKFKSNKYILNYAEMDTGKEKGFLSNKINGSIVYSSIRNTQTFDLEVDNEEESIKNETDLPVTIFSSKNLKSLIKEWLQSAVGYLPDSGKGANVKKIIGKLSAVIFLIVKPHSSSL